MTADDTLPALMNAIKENDFVMGHALLQQTLVPTATDDLQRSPLMLAVQHNRLWFVAELLAKGYSPDQKDNTGLPPLIAAAARGHDAVFELLLNQSQQIAAVNRFGGTALLPSSEKGHLRTVQLAIAANIPINHQNRLGWSALLEAVILGDGGYLYQEVVRELVTHGAAVQQVDFANKDSLMYAQDLKQLAIVAILTGHTQDEYDGIRSLIKNNQLHYSLSLLMQQTASGKRDFFLGYVYERLEKFEESAYYYHQGLEQDSQFAFYLANLASKQGNNLKALAYFDLGISRQETPFFRYHKANYLRDTGQHPAAIQEMDALLADHPNRVDYMFHKANSLSSLGRYQEALATMELAAQNRPDQTLFSEQIQRLQKIIKEQAG